MWKEVGMAAAKAFAEAFCTEAGRLVAARVLAKRKQKNPGAANG